MSAVAFLVGLLSPGGLVARLRFGFTAGAGVSSEESGAEASAAGVAPFDVAGAFLARLLLTGSSEGTGWPAVVRDTSLLLSNPPNSR